MVVGGGGGKIVAVTAWGEVLRGLAEATAGAPLLMYGSRAPRWPDVALPSSDYDLLVVREGAPPQKRVVDLGSEMRIDLTILARRAVQNGRLMSPQQHVADRWGERSGDWTWYDLDRPLSWLGADAALGTLQCEAEVALQSRDDAPWLCGLGVRALRRGLTLLYALGVLGDAAPTWALIEERYGLPDALVHALRVERALAGDPRVGGWAAIVATALQDSLCEVGRAVAAYPKNSSDAVVEQRLAGAHA